MAQKTLPKTDSTKAVAYIRVSTDKQELGPEAQRAGIAQWAAQHGVQVTSWHIEEDVHGDSPCISRPVLGEALTALGDAGLLLALRRDRVARDAVETALFERHLEQRGVRLATADGLSEEQTPEGALLRGVVDLISAYELASIRRRTKEALAAKRARGEVSGTVPYGYRLANDGRHLELHPEEQAVVAQARTLRASGLPVRGVARELRKRGVVSRRGLPLGISQIFALIRVAA
jgi:DNA invertase Pin-like site-specific DNA recombinase